MGLGNYLKETRVEMKHVSWPSRQQAINYTLIVIVVSLVIAAYLGLFDSLFSYLIQKVILK